MILDVYVVWHHPVQTSIKPSFHPTPPTIASTKQWPSTTLPPMYTHFHLPPLITLASTTNVETVLKHPQKPCWIAYNALHRTAFPNALGLLCAANTPEMRSVAIMFDIKVPSGNRSMSWGRVLMLERKNRRMVPGGASSIGKVARCLHEFGPRKYRRRAMR